MSGPQRLLEREIDRPAVGSFVTELAEGLMLVRASTVKMLRLQLAMERRDQSVALQTLDDLVDLDAKIAAFLEQMPPCETLDSLARDADEQRSKLVQEKFGLAAGLLRRSADRAPPTWIEPASGEASGATVAIEASIDPTALSAEDALDDSAGKPSRSRMIVAQAVGVLLALLALASVVLLFLGFGPATLFGSLERSFVR
jgi:hypothetical protein